MVFTRLPKFSKNLAMYKKFAAACLLISLIFLPLVTVWADDPCKNISDLDDRAECYEKEIEEKEEEYQSTSNKLSKIREEKEAISKKMSDLGSQLSVTQNEINELEEDINKTKKDLEVINENLTSRKNSLGEKIDLRNKVLRNYSKKHLLNDIETFLSYKTGTDLALTGFQIASFSKTYNKVITDEIIKVIGGLNSEIKAFERDKAEGEGLKQELEDAQTKFLALKAELDRKKSVVQSELSDVSEEESDVSGNLEDISEEIAELSSKQQAIVQAKSGDFSASLSEGVETDDPRSDLSYKPNFSPAFAAFSYGAYTHRNGMSQYGAQGRAKYDNQNYEEILDFYYETDVDTEKDLDNKEICVEGEGKMQMKNYLKGLGEMPPTWHEEALKAQAVAARTYAYRYTKGGKCICTSTNCQYFSSDLVDKSSRQKWYDAIKNTQNEILEGNVSAQYSSTTGGYINNVGWDADGSWPKDAYEKKAGSPWFYKAWFTQTHNKNSSTCKRSHPWLTGEEMADILNAYVLLKAGKNTERVVPETINGCKINGISGNPYDKAALRKKAKSIDSNTGFERATSVKNGDGGDPFSKKLIFTVDGKEYSVDRQLFMKAFNVRAPGYIAIKYSPDSRALFNIEKK